MGEDERRPFFTQLGNSYIGLTVQTSVTAPVGSSINGAYVDLSPGKLARRQP